MNLSDKLWYLMNRYGLTRADLSKQTGLPYTTIDSILKRKDFEKVKLSTLHSLKKYFGVSLDYLICDEIEDASYGAGIPSALNSDNSERAYQYKLSPEAADVAEAYEKADFKSKNSARYALDLPLLELGLDKKCDRCVNPPQAHTLKVAARGQGVFEHPIDRPFTDEDERELDEIAARSMEENKDL